MKKLAIIVLMLVGSACGQTDPPTTSEITSNWEFFETTSPRGIKLECVQYGDDSEGTSQSKSWFAFSCWRLNDR